jgi:oxygen-independent coproporphyrinogen-3 oxidase
LHDAFDLSALEEQTIECSPETVTVEKLRTLASYGATRLSIGAQSFDKEELRKAGRAHSPEQISEAVKCAHNAGFTDVNIDLIAGFPGQATAVLAESVRKTVDLQPSHVTVYVYRATAGTAMAEQVRRGKRQASEYDVMLASYRVTRGILEASGYHEYAIGYFTRDRSRPCRADQYYFSIEGDYFGFGGGAHSIFGHHFFENAAAQQDAFIDDPLGFSQCEHFSVATLSRLLTSLSQTLWIPDGISFERFERLYGIPFNTIARDPGIQAFMKYYEMCGARFESTDTYLRVTPETMVPAYIRALSLYGTQNEGRAVSRARANLVQLS